MATRLALLATARAIQRLLTEASGPTEFFGAEIKVVQAADLSGDTPPLAQGVTVFLYRVTASPAQRNPPGRVTPARRRTRPPLLLDLHFMLTPWAASADTQLRLLNWAMRVLEDTPILTASVLNHDDPGQAVFRADETVELVFDPLSIPDMDSLSKSLHQPRLMPSATYVARLVSIDSEEDVTEGLGVEVE